MNRKRLQGTEWIALAVLAAVGLTVVASKAQTGGPGNPATRAAQSAALSNGGLAAAAAVSGSYVGTYREPTDSGPADLNELADFAQLVVVASAEAGVCRLSADRRSIETVLTVRPEILIKGKGGIDRLLVAVPGGRMVFADGSTADIHTPGFVRPNLHKRAVWFLRHAKGRLGKDGEFVLASGPLGFYDLEPPTRAFVMPAGALDSLIAKDLAQRRVPPADFVTLVTAAAQ